MTPVEKYITNRFLTLYGSPLTDDPIAFVAEYGKALNGTAADLLEEASDLIVSKHKYRNWPTPGECREAVNQIAERRMAAANRERFGRAPMVPVKTATPEARARVAALVEQATKHLADADRDAWPQQPWVPTDRKAWGERFGA